MFPLQRLLCLPFLLLPLFAQAQEGEPCAAFIAEMRVLAGDRHFPLKWRETTMRDGKPLVVSIEEKEGALSLAFVKTGEGLWAESTGTICSTSTGLEARFSAGQLRLGPAANWVMRYALATGGRFTLTRLGSGQLRIATSGWSGDFVPQP